MSAKLVGCDTSVLIPMFSRQHPQHDLCRPHLTRLNALPAHVLLETYSWLTGRRDGNVLPPNLIVQALAALETRVVQLPADSYIEMLSLLAKAGRTGAGVYDAQIAATAKHHGLKLLSRDQRAAAIYELVGVDYELI